MPSDHNPESQFLFDAGQDAVHWPILRLFREYSSGHYWLVGIGLCAAVIYPAASQIPIFLVQTVVDEVLLGEPFDLPGFPASWVPASQLGQLVLVTGLLVGFAGLSVLMSWLSGLVWGWFAQAVQHDVRTDSYAKIQRLGMNFFGDQQTGQIMSILTSDVNQLNGMLERFLADIISIVSRFASIVAILFFMHWQLALVLFSVVPVMTVVARYFVCILRPKYREVRQRVGALNSRMENNLGGIPVIKAFTREDYEYDRVREASQDLYDRRWSVIRTRIKFFPAMTMINWVGFGAVLLVGGYWILAGPPWRFTIPLTVGTLLAFMFFSQQFSDPIMQAAHLIDRYYEARASVVRVFALQDYDIDITEDEDAIDLAPVRGDVSIEDVTFAYDNGEGSVLQTVTVSIPAGSFVGIVGPTGAGKSTLTKLLLRFYDPDSGVIRIDGHDLRAVDLRSLRREIGFVSQEPYLFTGTVRENIAYGRPTVRDETIKRAATIAHAHQFIVDLDNGYETQVGQRGVALSGGQRQRIALARAIVGDPSIFVLDEATSHVDTETEVRIQQALEDIVAERTTFAIAHRLSTIRHADVILVFDEGELVASGTHAELLEMDDMYANLWRVQVGELQDLPDSFLERQVTTSNR